MAAIEALSGSMDEGLPELEVKYFPDTQTLSVYTDRECHEGETLSSGFAVFYDSDDKAAGFLVMYDAERLLKPFVDAILAKRGIDTDEQQDRQDSSDSGVLIAQE